MTMAASPAAPWSGPRCSDCLQTSTPVDPMVVVYKIDRLTRSLADFAKLVERSIDGCLSSPSPRPSTPPLRWGG